MNPPLWARRLTPKWVRNVFRPLFFRLQSKVTYSQSFYEDQYHGKSYRLNERSLQDIMAEWESAGWKAKLFNVLDCIKTPLAPERWLEVACHHGKTAFWLAERFPFAVFYMFDFSRTAVDFCQRYNPIPERSTIWHGDVTRIEHHGKRFDNFFDAATLLDVTEHLPGPIYRAAICEIWRVLRPGGYLLLKQGHEILPEHINVLPEKRLVEDFKAVGFQLLERLPDRHYLMTKLSNTGDHSLASH